MNSDSGPIPVSLYDYMVHIPFEEFVFTKVKVYFGNVLF